MKPVVTCTLLACVLAGAQAAAARTLDLQRAGDAATSAASVHGQVGRVDCRRATAAVHTRLRDTAVCVARVTTPSGAGCYVFYELGLARKASRGVTIRRAWEPWCSAPVAAASAARVSIGRAATLVRTAAEIYGDVERVSCWTATRADGRAIRGRALCEAWLSARPGCVVPYEVRSLRGGAPAPVATHVPWCAYTRPLRPPIDAPRFGSG